MLNRSISGFRPFKSPLSDSPVSSSQVAANRSLSSPNILKRSENVFRPFKSPLSDSPLAKRKCRNEEKKENRSIGPTRPMIPANEYEELLKRILTKKFKVPIPDYVPDTHCNRTLGMRRTVIRRALHDPNACNALVLYTPPPDQQVKLTEREKIMNDTSKIQVHVVVDPGMC